MNMSRDEFESQFASLQQSTGDKHTRLRGHGKIVDQICKLMNCWILSKYQV